MTYNKHILSLLLLVAYGSQSAADQKACDTGYRQRATTWIKGHSRDLMAAGALVIGFGLGRMHAHRALQSALQNNGGVMLLCKRSDGTEFLSNRDIHHHCTLNHAYVKAGNAVFKLSFDKNFNEDISFLNQ